MAYSTWEFPFKQFHSGMDFPGGTSGKESACQCRRHRRCRFDPWVRSHCESSGGGAVPAILCDHKGRGSVQQFFSHFVKRISAQLLLLFTSLVSSQWDHYATSSHLYQDGTQCPAVFDCFQAGPNSVVWLESVFLIDFFY